MKLRFISLIGILLFSCYHTQQDDTLFEAGRSLGANKNKDLEEVSGLVASVANPGMLWAHNDSGNSNELFLLNEEAKTVKQFKLRHIRNRDWEDITLATDSLTGDSFLYVGEIGDNYSRHKYKYFYRLKEPTADQDDHTIHIDTLVVIMPDGPRDSEAIMYDPLSKNIYLFSKREPQIGLYEIPLQPVSDTLQAQKVAKLPLTQIVAANVSADGTEVLVKNYDQVYYWKRAGREPMADLLQRPPVKLRYEREPQGESIAWSRDGSGYFTLSENAHGERGKLLFYKRK